VSPAQTSLATQVERLNPFPGLRTFEPDEDYLFFGREQQIDELLRRLRTTRFLAIVGTSGSGKSSLVRAGLIPSLHGGAMTSAGSSWRVAIFRPGEDPIGNLAAALAAPEALAQEDTEDELTRSLFEVTLRASSRGLIECIRQARIPARANILVLVDQFEEIFRYKRSRREAGRDEAVALVKLLLAAGHAEVPCYVALTMRSDFIGNCMELGDLPERVNAGLYLVPRMTRDELRAAVTGPVAVGGGTIAPRLVSRLLNDVGDDPDQLPILQHALLRTWNRWEEDHEAGEPLDLRHYEAIGTMKEALSRHAEEAFGELDAGGRRIAELMFKLLTDKGTDARGIRRPAPLSEICAVTGAQPAAVAAVVESFRRPGRSLLMPPAGIPLQDGSIVDLSHESLMRIWGRLSGWVEEEARSARLYLGAARAAARHAEGMGALWRDPELQLALTWREKEKPTPEWARRYDPGFEQAMAFLDASKAERDQEVHEREERRRRELRRARVLAAVLGSAAVVTFFLGGYAFVLKINAETALADATFQRNQAQREQDRAKQQEREALHQTGLAERQKRLAEQERSKAERQAQIAQEQRGIAEIERRNAEAKELEARAQKAQADAARLDAVGQRTKAEEQRTLAERLKGSAEASEREARRLGLLSSARALTLQIQRPQQDQPRDLPALLALQAYKLNRDNRGEAEDADLFNALRATLGALRPAPVLRGHGDAVRALALAPDGQTLVSGGEDGKLLQFDLRQPASPPAVLGSLASGIRSLALGGAGRLLAAGRADGRVSIWDLRSSASPPRELAGGVGVVHSVAFQPGGDLLAAGSADGTVRLWNPDRPESPAASLNGGGKPIAAVAFSPDGGTLAAGLSQAGGALLFDVRQPTSPPRTACPGLEVKSVAFSPDGKRLACGAGRGQIVLADVTKAGAPSVPLLGHASSVNSLSFSPGGDFLASASSDGKVRLWAVRSPGSRPIVLDGHDSWVWTVLFSPDGGKLVSGSEDRTVRIWEARTELLAAELCRAVRRSLTKDEWSRYMPPDLPFPPDQPCPASR
jgi:energy-coupling factor transporter ATP-binding protein EcfA2